MSEPLQGSGLGRFMDRSTEVFDRTSTFGRSSPYLEPLYSREPILYSAASAAVYAALVQAESSEA
jgi:hypothetical protein